MMHPTFPKLVDFGFPALLLSGRSKSNPTWQRAESPVLGTPKAIMLSPLGGEAGWPKLAALSLRWFRGSCVVHRSLKTALVQLLTINAEALQDMDVPGEKVPKAYLTSTFPVSSWCFSMGEASLASKASPGFNPAFHMLNHLHVQDRR
eukprot:1068339-Pelagomonas_calceolata.AAC.1